MVRNFPSNKYSTMIVLMSCYDFFGEKTKVVVDVGIIDVDAKYDYEILSAEDLKMQKKNRTSKCA